MTAEELQNLITEVKIKKCEKQNIELKEAHIDTPKRLYDTLSAFAN